MNFKLKLRSKGFYLQIFEAVTVLKFLQKLALDCPYICLQFFPGNFYRQMYRKYLKKVLGLLMHVTPSNFVSRILKSEALIYNSQFFQSSRFTEIIRHLNRFSYKHCNFSRVCLLVKMASKTVTRSIRRTLAGRCVFVKQEKWIAASVVDVFQVNKSQLGKFFHLFCPNSECGETKAYQADSSLGRPLFNFLCT